MQKAGSLVVQGAHGLHPQRSKHDISTQLKSAVLSEYQGSFKSSHTVRARDCLTRVKDSLPTCMRSGTVYKVPCTCGKYYIGESIRRLETRLVEHKEACFKGDTHKSAIADHAWSEQNAIEWDNTTVIDRSSNRMNLMLKEALHIQLRPKQQQMNRDSGTDIPGCWVSTISGMSCSSAS